jgi:hypothetical protein
MLRTYAKAATQFLGAVLVFILSATAFGTPGDDTVTTTEWFEIIVLALGVVPIALIPNTIYQGYAKAIVAGFVAVVAMLPTVMDGGLSWQEAIKIIVVFGVAAGVLTVSNVGDVYDRTVKHRLESPTL